MEITLFAVRLVLTGRWSVGAPGDVLDEIDVPMLIDVRPSLGRGTVHLPGTTLAGSLKAHLGELGETWLGPAAPSFEERTTRSPTNTAGRPARPARSSLAVLGAELTSPTQTTIRHSTAIDVARGAAAGHSGRLEQYAEPAEFIVHLEATTPAGDVEDLRRRLLSWSPQLGRGASTGLGAARCTEVWSVTVDLTNAVHLSWWLTRRSEWPLQDAGPAGTRTAHEHRPAGPATDETDTGIIRFDWQVTEPVHLGVGDAPDADGGALGAMTSRGGKGVVPGSSWKGIYRSRSELVLKASGVDARSVIKVLYGDQHRRGLLRFYDSVSDHAPTHLQTHVAIDRFTGGAVDGGLFTVRAIPRGASLRQTIGWTGPDPVPSGVVDLLSTVARDLHDNLIGVGGHGARGYGSVRTSQEPPIASLEATLLVAAMERLMDGQDEES